MADIRSALTVIRRDIRHLGECMDRRIDQVDRRIENVEHRFGWLVGIVLTGFVAVMGGLLGVAYQ